MESLDGYLFSKLTAMGSKSEGPIYFLQVADDSFYKILKETEAWEPDPNLHLYLNYKVNIKGTKQGDSIKYESIKKKERQ